MGFQCFQYFNTAHHCCSHILCHKHRDWGDWCSPAQSVTDIVMSPISSKQVMWKWRIAVKAIVMLVSIYRMVIVTFSCTFKSFMGRQCFTVWTEICYIRELNDHAVFGNSGICLASCGNQSLPNSPTCQLGLTVCRRLNSNNYVITSTDYCHCKKDACLCPIDWPFITVIVIAGCDASGYWILEDVHETYV